MPTMYKPHQLYWLSLTLSFLLFYFYNSTATPKNFHVDSDKTSSRPRRPPVNTMLTPPSVLMALRTSSRTLAPVIKCHEVKLTRFLVRSVYVRCTPRLLSFRQINFFNWSQGIEYQIWLGLIVVGCVGLNRELLLCFVYMLLIRWMHTPYPWMCVPPSDLNRKQAILSYPQENEIIEWITRDGTIDR